MKVLVTGGAGYIGSHTAESLIQSGHDVTVLDNFSRGFRSLVHPKAQLVEADILDTELVSKVMRHSQIEAVIHFAAFTGVAESLVHPDLSYKNNFGGTWSLLQACRDAAV